VKSDGVHGKQDADKQTEKRTRTFASYERILRQSKTDTKKKKKKLAMMMMTKIIIKITALRKYANRCSIRKEQIARTGSYSVDCSA